MPNTNSFYTYVDDKGTFRSVDAAGLKTIYSPLCAPSSEGIKSSISPFLSGDIKIDKHSFVTKPVSREDLRQDTRNFFVSLKNGGVVSLAQHTAKGDSFVEVGLLWHKVSRTFASEGVEISSVNFIPVTGENVEVMKVTVKNVSDKDVTFTPTVSVPIFARSLANKHDHEHVTSLLNRIEQVEGGIVVNPTLVFDEEGHRVAKNLYFALGVDDQGASPIGSFPTIENFCGAGGNLSRPEAVLMRQIPKQLSEGELNGQEAVGALQFAETTLLAGQEKAYIFVVGVQLVEQRTENPLAAFDSVEKVNAALMGNQNHWTNKSQSICYQTGDKDFDSWMKWVTVQPVLRRIFGCSFLPDHDYGKGGKGWRDIWQDLLSLILIEPEVVRENLINNFAGVRIDGTNATIIGERMGEFVADRNTITRVWMDHGTWPFLTTLLYLHQTGDFKLLFEEVAYFCDRQQSRATKKNDQWAPRQGNKLNSKEGIVYEGTILEHILVQHLTQFFNVGDHNIIRLENADWNDGLDMAGAKGESVAFSCLYAGNLIEIADLLETAQKTTGIETIALAKEMELLLDTLFDNSIDYENPKAKQARLYDGYYPLVEPQLSGLKKEYPIKDIVKDLRAKGEWLGEHIRKQEKVTVKDHSWFNGYYDNKGKRVEGEVDQVVRMTLTGQVFPIMSGVATKDEVSKIIKSVNAYLKDAKLKGYRLNTDFKLPYYLDLGRAFGFAYGTKENGAFFSHMIVMYAYALYKQGFVKEGYEVIRSIYSMSSDTARSQIYPGVPEYFDSNGRGMYHYLTGSASWFVLTMLNQSFGVRSFAGDFMLHPKLVLEQFDKEGNASVSCSFAGKRVVVNYVNKGLKTYGEYSVTEIKCGQTDLDFVCNHQNEVVIKREIFENFNQNEVKLFVFLG